MRAAKLSHAQKGKLNQLNKLHGFAAKCSPEVCVAVVKSTPWASTQGFWEQHVCSNLLDTRCFWITRGQLCQASTHLSQ